MIKLEMMENMWEEGKYYYWSWYGYKKVITLWTAHSKICILILQW